MLQKALRSHFVITIIFRSRSVPPILSLFIFFLILRINKAKWKLMLLLSMKTQNLIIANECNNVGCPRLCVFSMQKVTWAEYLRTPSYRWG